jgi:hypothetical protein
VFRRSTDELEARSPPLGDHHTRLNESQAGPGEDGVRTAETPLDRKLPSKIERTSLLRLAPSVGVQSNVGKDERDLARCEAGTYAWSLRKQKSAAVGAAGL